MKRLFLYLFAAIVAFSFVFTFGFDVTEASAKAKPKTKASATSVINMDKLIGADIGSVTAQYGKQSRIDPSEYGFKWYVFKKDYKRFMMVGVDGGKVVAAYCNSKYLLAQGSVKIGMTRSQVRSKFGTPVTCIQSGNTVYVFPNTDKKDIYIIDGYYVYFYYDIYDKYKVTSVMMVKKEYEEGLMGKPLEMTKQLIAAFSNQSIDLVNSIRVRRGLSKLSYYSPAASLALYRSTDMRNRGYFSHYSPEGKSPAYIARKRGMKFKTMCENIAYGHRNAISAFEAFMNSKGHRSNILYKKVKQIGVGTAFGGKHSVLVTYIMMTKK